MENSWRLSHLYATVFLSIYATNLANPAITDVVVEAICGGKRECSLAIYLTGFQQAITGLGAVVMMPLIGNLSDIYGRKRLLLLPLLLSIFPLVILACNRRTEFVYAYYAFKMLTAMVTEGGVIFLGIASVADNVSEEKRVSAFGLMCGIMSAAIVCGNFTARLLSIPHIFQVAAGVSMVAVTYAIVFVKEKKEDKYTNHLEQPILEPNQPSNNNFIKKIIPSPTDIFSLLRRSNALSLLMCVSFFNGLAETGVQTSIMYSLKARFNFNKNQFAELTLIANVGSILSNMIFMPLLGPFIGDKRLLALGLIGGFISMFLYSIAWSTWVFYAAATLGFFFSTTDPNIRSLVSRQTGTKEQGIAQGCISSMGSLANVVGPMIFTPLTALFLSEDAPFHFPGFSLFCTALAYLMGYIMSLFIKITPVEIPETHLEAGHIEQ